MLTGAGVVLVVGKDLVGGSLGVGTELRGDSSQLRRAIRGGATATAHLRVGLAGVPEEGDRVLLDGLEVIGDLEEGGVRNDGDLEQVLEFSRVLESAIVLHRSTQWLGLHRERGPSRRVHPSSSQWRRRS